MGGLTIRHQAALRLDNVANVRIHGTLKERVAVVEVERRPLSEYAGIAGDLS